MNDRFARAGAIARIDLAHEPDFVLGGIEVRPSLRELARDGWRETIDRRVMQVLVALARANGKVVSRDDLIESCWDGVIVGDEAINRCISRLRKAAEASGNAFSIETLSRVGYRLKSVETVPLAPIAVSPPALEATHTALTVESLRPASPELPAAMSAPTRTGGLARIAGMAAILVLGIAAAAAGLIYFRHLSSRAPAAAPESVAVLPFVNMSGNPSREIISDGISEELLDDLSNVSALRVAARTSSFAFKGKNVDVKQIARMLLVHSVLEGSILEDGQRIRISAQLIDATDGFRVWSATYDRQMTGMLTLEDDIARAITAAITHKILPAPRTAAGRPASIDPDVYRKYLEGMHDLGPREEAGTTKAVALFRDVTAAQPDFAAGFAALGRALINHAEDYPQQKDIMPKAEEALAQALALDPDNIEALGVELDLALHKLDWQGAADYAKRMRDINPNSTPVLHEMFRYYQHLGFPVQALEAAQGVVLLDPLSVVDRLNVTAALIHVARFGEAAAAARAALALRPDQTSIRGYLCTAYAHSGQLEQARTIAAQFSKSHDRADADGCQFDIAVGEGRTADARRLNDAFVAQYPNGNMRAVDLADNFALIGDAKSAVQWMGRAYDLKDFDMFSVPFDRAIPQAVFADAGWKALMQRPLFRDWQAAHDRLAGELGVAK